ATFAASGNAPCAASASRLPAASSPAPATARPTATRQAPSGCVCASRAELPNPQLNPARRSSSRRTDGDTPALSRQRRPRLCQQLCQPWHCAARLRQPWHTSRVLATSTSALSDLGLGVAEVVRLQDDELKSHDFGYIHASWED